MESIPLSPVVCLLYLGGDPCYRRQPPSSAGYISRPIGRHGCVRMRLSLLRTGLSDCCTVGHFDGAIVALNTMIMRIRHCQDKTSPVNGLAVTGDEQLFQV